MRITADGLQRVKIHDEMGNQFQAHIIDIETETELNTAFTDLSPDRTWYIHARIINYGLEDHEYKHITNNYPEELIISRNDNPNKGPVIRAKWREVQHVYDDPK